MVKVAGREHADGDVVWEGLAYEVDEAFGYRQPTYADIEGWDGRMRAIVDSKYTGAVRVQRWNVFDGNWNTVEFGDFRIVSNYLHFEIHPPSPDLIVRLVTAGRLAAVIREHPRWRLRLALSGFRLRLLSDARCRDRENSELEP